MESTDPKEALDAMAALFSFLVKNAIISEYQVAKGVSRLKKLLPDLTLDVPTAPVLLADFEDMAQEMGCVPSVKDKQGVEEQEPPTVLTEDAELAEDSPVEAP